MSEEGVISDTVNDSNESHMMRFYNWEKQSTGI